MEDTKLSELSRRWMRGGWDSRAMWQSLLGDKLITTFLKVCQRTPLRSALTKLCRHHTGFSWVKFVYKKLQWSVQSVYSNWSLSRNTIQVLHTVLNNLARLVWLRRTGSEECLRMCLRLCVDACACAFFFIFFVENYSWFNRIQRTSCCCICLFIYLFIYLFISDIYTG